MKKLIFSIVTAGFIGLNLISCSSDDDSTPVGGSNTDINTFIWSGLNDLYYWQSNVPNLSDDISTDAYQSLILNNTPETLFDRLLYQKGVVDRNSILRDDYTELENLLSGVSVSSGARFATGSFSGSNRLFFVTLYVEPNTSAAEAGIKRGDIFIGANGQDFTENNYQDLLSQSTLELDLATVTVDENGTTIGSSGNTITVQTSEFQENPLVFNKVIEENGKKIGYVVFNSFDREFNDELNQVFGELKAEGVSELILDLRYNRGGDVEMASYLASMIYGGGTTDQLFTELRYNEKLSKFGRLFYFQNQLNLYELNQSSSIGTESINRLNLNRVYLLCTKNTASSSELIINGLNPFMEVVLVGQTTYGKDVASFTVYDSPDYSKNNVNPDHKYAMQPIVAKNYNGQGESDYNSGFEPDITADDITDLSNIYLFGEVKEPMLNAALTDIDPSFSSSIISSRSTRKEKKIQLKLLNSDNPLYYEMTIRQ